MALPQQIDKTNPADSDNPSAGASVIRQLKTFLEDVFGLTDATNYTLAPFAITTAGVVTVKVTPFTLDTGVNLVVGGTVVVTGLATFNAGISVPTGQNVTGAGTAQVTGFATISATTLTGALSTAAQPNITSVGTLTALTISGTLTLTGATVAGTPTWSSSQAITLSTAAQPNITSVGTLTALTVSGAINKVTITAPAASATLTLATGSSLITAGANSLTLTTTGPTNVTLPTSGTLATTGGSGTLTAGTSATQNPFAVNTETTQAHGLGQMPTMIEFYAECLTGEHGYTAGDRIFGLQYDGSGAAYGFNVSADATNTYITSAGTGLVVLRKNDGATVVATSANWKVVAVPYKLN